MRPFPTGLTVSHRGLDADARQGARRLRLWTALGARLRIALGSTVVLIIGITTLIAGTLLLSGASAGALIRRSGKRGSATAEAAKRARTALPETMPDLQLVEPIREAAARAACARARRSERVPDVVEADPPGPAPLLLEDPETAPDQTSLFDVGEAVAERLPLPDRKILRRSPAVSGNSADQNARVAEALVQTLRALRRRGDRRSARSRARA